MIIKKENQHGWLSPRHKEDMYRYWTLLEIHNHISNWMWNNIKAYRNGELYHFPEWHHMHGRNKTDLQLLGKLEDHVRKLAEDGQVMEAIELAFTDPGILVRKFKYKQLDMFKELF